MSSVPYVAVTPLARRAVCALPATAAAALALLTPEQFRPQPLAWVGGATGLALVVCLATPRRPFAAGLVAAAAGLGALVQLRLGAPPTRLGLLAAAATGAFVTAQRLGSRRATAATLQDPYRRRLIAFVLLGIGVVLRASAVFGPSPAAGTLPGLPVQIGELTRYLVAGGAAIAITELAACGRAGPQRLDRWFRVAVWSLVAVAVAELVGFRDLGPAVLLLVGVAAATVHVHGLRPKPIVAIVVGVALAAPLLWSSSTLRGRVDEVFAPGSQLRAAMLAATSGGLIGPGPGGSPLVAGVPAIGSDYAVAALVADLGVLVVVPVLLALLLTYASVLRSAASRPDTAATLAAAVIAMLWAQACWSALGTVGVLPLTGLNQPFLGISGASLLVSAAVVGLALGIADRDDPIVVHDALGARPLARTADIGTRAVALLAVVAAGMLAFAPAALTDTDQLRMPRGAIATADGHVISYDGNGERIYPDGGLYADLGVTRWNVAHRGLDAVRADTLVCGGRLGVADWVASLVHPVCKPADVITTVDSRVQDAAAAALKGQEAEVVVYDSRTGDVLALYATSSTEPGAPPTARTNQGPPGSTMKIVTAAAALLAHLDFSAAPAGRFTGSDGQVLANDRDEICPATDPSTALAYSCNSVYGWAAAQVGPQELQRVARTYFGADQPFRLDGADASGLDTGATTLEPGAGPVARTGIGQESVRSSVLGMAVATGVIANGEQTTTPWPRLTSAVCTDGDPATPATQSTVGPSLPESVAAPIYDGMHAAVEHGTARQLTAPPGIEVAAKTGTAQVADGVDSWVTTIVDRHLIVTVVVHKPQRDSAAVRAASSILPAVPTTTAPPVCPTNEVVP